MKAFLLSIGKAAECALSTVFFALTGGVAQPVPSLDVLSLTQEDASAPYSALCDDLNACHEAFSFPETPLLFPSSPVFSQASVALPSLERLTAHPSSRLLLSALRGAGAPLSYSSDREAVEWAFSSLLNGPESGELSSYSAWKNRIAASLAKEPVRVSLLCDLCDPFSAGLAFTCLRDLRKSLAGEGFFLSLLAFAGNHGGAPAESARETLREALQSLRDARLLCDLSETPTAGADAMWLISLPASLVESEESWLLADLAAARVLSRVSHSPKAPAPGLHTLSVPGTLSLQSLGEQAAPAVAMIRTAVWLLGDLLPSLRSYLSHPTLLRSLAPSSRSAIFRRLLRNSNDIHGWDSSLQARLERVLKWLLAESAHLSRAIPGFFLPAPERESAWQQAVEACGRTVTVAAEGIVSRMEAEESGVMTIMPVHRTSMADTEEEQARTRLEEIDLQLKSELEQRETLLKSLGGCLSCLVRADCLGRCEDALRQAMEKQRELEQSGRDGTAMAAQLRRIRLLSAAVDWCRQDLKQIPHAALISSPADSPSGAGILSSQAVSLFSSLTSGTGTLSEEDQKALRELLPGLFPGLSLSDARGLLRELSAAIHPEGPLPPLQALISGAFSVCLAEAASQRYLSVGSLPAIPLLPDLYAGEPLVTLGGLLALFPVQEQTDDSSLRGVLAFLLLRVYRRMTSDEAGLRSVLCRMSDSPVIRCWLEGRQANEVRFFSLEREDLSLPVAMVLPGMELIQPRWTRRHAELIPSFVTWFDRETLRFQDPVPFLGESDRLLLSERIDTLLRQPGRLSQKSGLSALLQDFLSALRAEPAVPEITSDFSTRLKAAFGLRLLPAFQDSLHRVVTGYERFLSDDPVASALTDLPDFPASVCPVEEETLYTWRDVPIAREHSRLLLEAIAVPEEKGVLSMLREDSKLLFSASDDYRDTLVRELSQLLERRPDALPERRRAVLELMEEAGAPMESAFSELSWPWDPLSPSVRTILRECLGESLSQAVTQPFSDRLMVFPARGGELIGDTLLSQMCAVLPLATLSEGADSSTLRPDAVLPPLSPSFSAVLCGSEEGKTLLHPGFLTFERKNSGAIQVTVALEGNFSLRLTRLYETEEQILFYAQDLPTLAVWPSAPFLPEDWHAFFLYAHLPASCRVSVIDAAGRPADPLAGDGPRFVSRLSAFPVCFRFHQGDLSLGALPNLLPTPRITRDRAVTACVDFGSVGTSVIFSSGRDRYPLHGPTMVRVLLNHSAASPELLRREFLPAVPVSALLPTVSRLFRNVPGEAPAPFEDGIILMPADLEDVLTVPRDALYTCLKWEQEKGRSGTLCLHQLMLMTALQARSDGARTLSWRFAIPDGMAKEGRERLMNLFQSLAEEVARESGFPRPEKGFPAVFASESAALGAYFRLCSPEETRGGFMALDIGACTADIALFLRGREQAVSAVQIPLGIHYLLLPELLRQPDLLSRELGVMEDPGLRADLSRLTEIFRAAATDTASLRHSRLALDLFIADRLPALLPFFLQHPATGAPTRLGSLLLLYFSFLMTLSALMLLRLSSDPNQNDLLPERMWLCLSGRGSSLMEMMPDQIKTGFWHFLTMFRNQRVTSLSLLFSAEKKMEIPVGLSVLQELSQGVPPASSVPTAIAVRPEALLPEFLLRFRQGFAPCADQLFPGFFTNDPYHPFSPFGESLLSATIQQAFGDREGTKPYDALASWPGLLLEAVRESLQTGEGGTPWNS